MKHHRGDCDRIWDTSPVTQRPIVTKFDIRCMPFPWSATFGEYEIGDLIGIGETEEEAILDLKLEDDLNDA